MKLIIREPGQTDILLRRLDDILDMSHKIILLAALIDWEAIKRDYAEHFPSHTGRPATRGRLAAGLLYLQHTYKIYEMLAGKRLYGRGGLFANRRTYRNRRFSQ